MVWVNRLQMNRQILMAQADCVELRMISRCLPSQEYLPCTWSGPGPSGGAGGGSGWDPNKPRQEVSHLALYISDDNEFADDLHQIIPVEDAFALTFQDRIFRGSTVVTFYQWGYWVLRNLLPWIRWCQAWLHWCIPWDYPLDCQGHVALKLHSSIAAYSSYIRLVLTRIVDPQQEDPDIKIDQYSYFDIIGTIRPPIHHGISGCLHYLPLVSNIFLAWYDSGTFLSHLTDGGYGFDSVGSPGLDMYQMYVVSPWLKEVCITSELA